MNELKPFIQANSSDFINDLGRLCNQPSISAQGKGISECAELVASIMREVGLEVRIIPIEGGAPIIFGEHRSNPDAKTLLFYNHYDVQPAEPLEEWKSDPFKMTLRDGRIYARGVADDKGDLIARIEAIKTLRKARDNVPVNLKFIVEGEEEIGSPHLESFLKQNHELIAADGCLWEGGSRDVSGRPELYFGMKGILYVELSVKTAETDQHSMWAPIVANPAWRLTWALNSLKDENERILIKGWYDDVRTPDHEEMIALKRMALGEAAYKKVFGIKRFLKGASGERLRRSLVFNPTCTICGIQSGYLGKGPKTVNPSKASAKIDFRLVPDQDPIKQYAKLKRHLKSEGFGDVEAALVNSQRPAKTSLESEVSLIAKKTARAVYQCEPNVWPLVPGSGPMALFVKDMEIPTVSAGVGYYDAGEHAPNENIRIEDFLLGIEHVARMIESF